MNLYLAYVLVELQQAFNALSSAGAHIDHSLYFEPQKHNKPEVVVVYNPLSVYDELSLAESPMSALQTMACDYSVALPQMPRMQNDDPVVLRFQTRVEVGYFFYGTPVLGKNCYTRPNYLTQIMADPAVHVGGLGLRWNRLNLLKGTMVYLQELGCFRPRNSNQVRKLFPCPPIIRKEGISPWRISHCA